MAVAAYSSAPAPIFTASSPCASSAQSVTHRAPQFAFARVRGAVCLVHCAGPASPLLPQDVSVFRHEFISIFRFSHTAALHPADFAVLEPLDELSYSYEPDTGTLTLSRTAVERLRKLSGPVPAKTPAYPQRSRRVVRGWNSALS